MTDVSIFLFSYLNSIGKQATDFIFSDLKVEDLWVDQPLLSKKTKKEQFLQELLIKVNFLFVIGQQGQLMKQVVKMKQLLDTGIKRGAIDQLLL